LRHAQQLLLHLRREVRHVNLCSGRITHSDGRWHREWAQRADCEWLQ
jgi:hypothetical protein